MVDLAILIGIFGYLIFGLGLVGKLNWLGGLGVFFLVSLLALLIKKEPWKGFKVFCQEIKKEKISLIFLGLLILQALVNLIGALGPELGFDALWYHLTIPKIYLQHQQIFFIPGNLFYYSAMPKLTEMFYLLSLPFSPSGTLAKLIHFSFGLLSAIALYNLSRRFLKPKWALATSLVFYSTLIVGWQSITAYIDLTRTFFEILALDQFLLWFRAKKKENLLDSAITLGLAVSTKLLALATLPIFLILILIKSKKFQLAGYYLLSVILIPLPWLVFSLVQTGNPVYPLFAGILDSSHNFVFPHALGFLKQTVSLFFRAQDPISPLFLIFLPLLFFSKKLWQTKVLKPLAIYLLLALVFWYLTPQTGGSRFVLPYLPALSLLLAITVFKSKTFFQKAFLILLIVVSFAHIGYRSLANKKFVPVVFGQQTKESFLSQNLNFEFGDFYNGEIKNIIKKEDLVLILGGHNLFYVNFPFVHYSYAPPKTYFSYLLLQDTSLPRELESLKLLYEDSKTKTKLYLFGKQW